MVYYFLGGDWMYLAGVKSWLRKQTLDFYGSNSDQGDGREIWLWSVHIISSKPDLSESEQKNLETQIEKIEEAMGLSWPG